MSAPASNPGTRIALFQRKEVRRAIHNNEWWFVVEDVVLALTDSRDAKQYIQRMKQRDPDCGKGWGLDAAHEFMTQRADTLRLDDLKKGESSWRERLWTTHVKLNAGARAFGDFLRAKGVTAIDAWIENCLPSLRVTIRDDAVWVQLWRIFAQLPYSDPNRAPRLRTPRLSRVGEDWLFEGEL